MKLNRKERRGLRKENKTKVFLAGLAELVRAAKRAGLELDDLSKFLGTDIIPAGTDCGKSTILLKLVGATQKEKLKND